MGHRVHWKVAGCFCMRLLVPASWLFWYSGSARRKAITLLGTEEVDCRLREADEPTDCRSRGDKDRDDVSERVARSTPREGPKLPGGRIPLPGWNGSVTALGRDLGRPLSGGVSES